MNPKKMDWYTANGPDGAAKHTPAVTGYTWRVPAQSEFKQIFKATSGSEENYKNINDMLAVFGDSCKLPWEDEVGTSTPTTYLGMDEYWFVDLYHNVADYALFHATKSHASTIERFSCWGTRTRTRKGRTRICSVTITPYPKLEEQFPNCGCKGSGFFRNNKEKTHFFIKNPKIFCFYCTFRIIPCIFVGQNNIFNI